MGTGRRGEVIAWIAWYLWSDQAFPGEEAEELPRVSTN